jgi:hypothetical protein
MYDDFLTGIQSKQLVKALYQWPRPERSEKTEVWGRIPQDVR